MRKRGFDGGAARRVKLDLTNKETQTLETPCQNICQLDPDIGLCTGCGRSSAEIAGWRDMTPQDRRAIMAVLAARLAIVQTRLAAAQ